MLGTVPLRIAIAQIAPRLGSLAENLVRHRELIAESRARGAQLVVPPGLALTGSLLQDLAADVAMRLDDPRLMELASTTHALSAAVSFVEESADHRLFIAAALLEDGEIRHVHRKLFLPTYCLFDERRFLSAVSTYPPPPAPRADCAEGLVASKPARPTRAPHPAPPTPP